MATWRVVNSWSGHACTILGTGADLRALGVKEDADVEVRPGRGGLANARDGGAVGLVVAVANVGGRE